MMGILPTSFQTTKLTAPAFYCNNGLNSFDLQPSQYPSAKQWKVVFPVLAHTSVAHLFPRCPRRILHE